MKEPKDYNVLQTDDGLLIVCKIGNERSTDTFIDGPFTYLKACDRRDEKRSSLKIKADPKRTALQDLIKALDKFTGPEIEKVLRGDVNIGLRRKAKNLSVKLAAASIKTGIEAVSFKPVPEKKENK